MTPANAADGLNGIGLLDSELSGLQVLADSAYGSGEVRAQLRARGHRQAIKAIPLRRAVPGGFNRDDFSVDHDARTVTCPAGHTVPITPGRHASFDQHCASCPLRSQCTTAKDGLHLTFHLHDRELIEARRAWRQGDFADDYRRWRPMVERSLAWLVANGNRRVRYRGVTRNHLWLSLRVAAINLRRLINLGLTSEGATWAISS